MFFCLHLRTETNNKLSQNLSYVFGCVLLKIKTSDGNFQKSVNKSKTFFAAGPALPVCLFLAQDPGEILSTEVTPAPANACPISG